METSIPTGRCATARSGTITNSNAATSTAIKVNDSRDPGRLWLESEPRALAGGTENFINIGYQ